ncbi:MAG: hypothetical protein AAB675_04010 [Patescibacteria group bacterium]
MANGSIEQKDTPKKGSSGAAAALRAATAVGVIAGGAVGAVSKDSTEASAGDSSWGARTEEFQPIDPTPTPEQVTEITPTPSSTPTIGEPSPTPISETPTATPAEPSPTPKWTASSVSATPIPETPTPTPSIGDDAWSATPSAPESPVQLPKAGGAVSENHRGGVKDKLMLALGSALSGIIGIGAVNKANKQPPSQK